MNDWKTYRSAYATADQATKEKLHSSLIPECVANACEKYELDPSHKRTIIQLFAFKTVGITNEAATAAAMREAGIPAAAVIAKEIDECIATKTPAIADTSLVVEELPEDTHSVETTEDLPAPQAPDTLAAELAETEAAFKALQPIRTMAHDMETLRSDDEPVHTAVDQETILNGQGNAAKNPAAQWGTPEK